MKTIITTSLLLLFSFATIKAQYFQADLKVSGKTLIFKVTPVGGDITTSISDVEFFIRWSTSYGNAVRFDSIATNTTNFPGLTIFSSNNDASVSDPGYNFQHFGYAATPTATRTYMNGVSYEVFRTTMSGGIPTSFQMVSDNANSINGNFTYYFAFLGNPDDYSPYNVPFSNYSGISGPSLYYLDAANAILPVTLKSFSGQAVNCNGLLSWTTTREVNSTSFEIQRSPDGVGFSTVATVPAVVNSSGDLAYNHTVPLTAPVNYYRLKMISTDDIARYSNVITLNSNGCAVIQPVVRVYPNPVVGHNLYVSCSGLGEETVIIEIEDAAGKRIQTWQQTVHQGNNQLMLQLPAATHGIYEVKMIRRGAGDITKKILVQ